MLSLRLPVGRREKSLSLERFLCCGVYSFYGAPSTCLLQAGMKWQNFSDVSNCEIPFCYLFSLKSLTTTFIYSTFSILLSSADRITILYIPGTKSIGISILNSPFSLTLMRLPNSRSPM